MSISPRQEAFIKHAEGLGQRRSVIDFDGGWLARQPEIDTLTARLSESEQREREAVAVVAALPDSAEGIRAFIGSNFNSLKYGRPDEASCDEDVYVVSAHDLLSAFSEFLEFHPQALSSLRQRIRAETMLELADLMDKGAGMSAAGLRDLAEQEKRG